METTIEQVEQFLNQFHEKLKIFDIRFRDDRGKNQQTLFQLEISPTYRLEVIKNLQAQDYYRGPSDDTLNHLSDLWEFGKTIKGQEVYIKITMGKPNSHTICISFHIAEHKINYPFKKGTKK